MNKQTILIVDDEEDLRDALATDLARMGYNICQAGSGSSAMELFARTQIDLIISDVRMAEKDGIDLLKWIRGKNSDTPAFILMSGYSDLSWDEAYELGANGFLRKPFVRRILHFEVSRHLSRISGDSYSVLPDPDCGLILPSEKKIVISKEAVRLGRGGFFLPGAPSMKIGDFAPFQVGGWTGFVALRWYRRDEVKSLPRGGGYEFIYFDELCRADAQRFLCSMPGVVYIPRF